MADPLPICYLNGDYLPLREARVSPLDRGFLFSDGVYEVMPVYAGRIFRFREHFDRLDRSLNEIQMRPVYARDRWQDVCDQLVKRNGGGDMYLYIQVTRGAEYGRSHAPLPDIERTVFAFAAPLPVIAPEKLERGVAAVTAEDNRWGRCDIKSVSLLANILFKQVAVAAGAQETILLRDGQLMEGSSTTVHVVINGEVRVPPNGHSILPGITRDVVSELIQRGGIPCKVTAVSEKELRTADEIFIAASTFGTLPVTKLDGKTAGNGKPGPVWKKVQQMFEGEKSRG